MRPDLLALVLVGSGTLLGGCLTRPSAQVETPEGLVLGEDPVAVEKVAQALRERGPILRAALDSPRYPPRIFLLEEFPHGAGGVTGPDFIALNNVKGVEEVAIHELVHWHSSPAFDRLPYYAREGLADAFNYALNTFSSGLDQIQPSPGANDLERMFAIKSGDLAIAQSDTFTDNAGAWVVAYFGWKRLREFCARAEAEGLSVVPDEWIRAELPPLGTAFGMDETWVTEGVPGKVSGTMIYRSS
jgi:hypothetical protein